MKECVVPTVNLPWREQAVQRDPSGGRVCHYMQSLQVASMDSDVYEPKKSLPPPLPSHQLGIDYSMPVPDGCILIINDSDTGIQFRVHDSPNNLHVTNHSTTVAQGGSQSHSEQARDSINGCAGPSRFSLRADTHRQHADQKSANRSQTLNIALKERKQLQAQELKVPAGQQQLINLTTGTAEVSVDAWYEKGATMNVMKGLVVRPGQALRIGRDSLAAYAFPEKATTPSSTPVAPAAASGAGGGGRPKIEFNC